MIGLISSRRQVDEELPPRGIFFVYDGLVIGELAISRLSINLVLDDDDKIQFTHFNKKINIVEFSKYRGVVEFADSHLKRTKWPPVRGEFR
jgi:hypothetical protein